MILRTHKRLLCLCSLSLSHKQLRCFLRVQLVPVLETKANEAKFAPLISFGSLSALCFRVSSCCCFLLWGKHDFCSCKPTDALLVQVRAASVLYKSWAARTVHSSLMRNEFRVLWRVRTRRSELSAFVRSFVLLLTRTAHTQHTHTMIECERVAAAFAHISAAQRKSYTANEQ